MKSLRPPRIALPLSTALVAVALLAGPAEAKRKKPGKQPPPAAIRCTLDLSLPGGDSLPVVAWGPDEAAATGQVRRTARLVAELHAHPDVWAALLVPTDEAPTSFAARLEAVPAATDGGDAPVFPIPGYGAGVPTCAPEELPAEAGGAWEVAWTGDSGEVVRRADAATALEASRRRACLLPYQREMAGMWRALVQIDPGQRQDRFAEIWSGAREALLGCYGQAGLHDGAEPQGPATPWIRPVGEPSARPAAVPVEGAAFDGFECRAREFSSPAPGATAVGWGTELEWAEEAALGTLVYAVSRDAFAQVAFHMDAASPETLPSLIADQALRLTQVVPPVQGLEGLQLSCERVRVDAGGAAALRWAPADPQVLDACEPPGGWASATEPAGSAGGPFDGQLALQQRLVSPGLVQVRAAWEASERDDQVAVLGLGAVAMCEASSLGDVALEGADGGPTPDPWTALLASPELARAQLDRALEQEDLAALAACLHPQQRPSSLQLYERILASDGDVASFWTQIRESLPPALESGALQWGAFDGKWLLVPSDTP